DLSRELQARVHDRILAPLADVRRRARWYLALDGLTRLVIAFIVAGAIQLLLDRWLKLSLDQRAVVNVAITIFWLWILYRHVLTRVLRPLPDHALATAIDRANPNLHDQLATAVQFATGRVGPAERNSPALVRAVLDDACQSAQQVSFSGVLNHERARRSAAELGVMTLGIVLVFLAVPFMSTWFKRNWLMQEV